MPRIPKRCAGRMANVTFGRISPLRPPAVVDRPPDMRAPCSWLIAATLLAGCGPAPPPTLVADYGFQNTLTSSVGSAPPLVAIGPLPNAFVSDTVEGASRTVLAFPPDDGLALSPTTSLLRSDRYSIVITFRLDTVMGYRRILD